jgi:hypothetical protein
MLLKNRNLNTTLFLLLFSVNIFAKQMPVLSTNQATNAIRFISQDGKFTYYQRRSGELVFSTNYSVSNVLADNAGAMYTVTGSSAQKKLIVSVDEYYYGFLNPSKSKKLYLIDYGKDKATFLGNGIQPQLHLNDTWVSYFDVDQNTLQVRSSTNELLLAKINLKSSINPHFRPSVAMSSENYVYYTDMNDQGEIALFHVDRVKQETVIIEKQKSHNARYEFCSNDKYIFIATFPINNSGTLSQIRMLEKSSPQFDKAKIVYEKSSQDIGSLICDHSDEFLYFIQSQSNNLKQPVHEIVKLRLSDQSVTKLSEFKNATNIFNMDGRLLSFFNGLVYIIEGDNTLASASNLPKMAPNAAPDGQANPEKLIENKEVTVDKKEPAEEANTEKKSP